MKTLKIFFLSVLVMVIAIQVSNAQDYKHPYNVNSSGQVVNQQGVKLGWIEADGTIKNSKGEVVGKVEKKDKQAIVLDKMGKKMGAVSENGSYTNGKGKVVYTISTADENGICKILDASGKEVGTVHENYKQQGACAIHCLSKKK
jgi:hypothetical protein